MLHAVTPLASWRRYHRGRIRGVPRNHKEHAHLLRMPTVNSVVRAPFGAAVRRESLPRSAAPPIGVCVAVPRSVFARAAAAGSPGGASPLWCLLTPCAVSLRIQVPAMITPLSSRTVRGVPQRSRRDKSRVLVNTQAKSQRTGLAKSRSRCRDEEWNARSHSKPMLFIDDKFVATQESGDDDTRLRIHHLHRLSRPMRDDFGEREIGFRKDRETGTAKIITDPVTRNTGQSNALRAVVIGAATVATQARSGW